MKDVRAHIEVFRLETGNERDKVIRADNRDEHPAFPVRVITYLSPQRRMAIYGSNDRTFSPTTPNGTDLIMAGTWEECFPIFEDYARMI